MAEIFDKYTLQVDVRYMEFLLAALQECRSINLGKYKESRGERLYRLRIQDKTIRQLELILREHKREAQLYNA